MIIRVIILVAALTESLLRSATPVIVELPNIEELTALEDFNISLANKDTSDWAAAQRSFIHQQLSRHAARTQSALKTLLDSYKVSYTSFWLVNCVFIREASPALISILRKLGFSVRAREVATVVHPVNTTIKDIDEDRENTSDYHLRMINVRAAWKVFNKGEGIVLASIDTGVRWTHRELRKSYRGGIDGDHDYNWLDARYIHDVPTDDGGHGTQTLSNAVGRRIGVAPGAKWIAVKGCGKSLCFEDELITAGEFVLCPTRRDGTGRDCDRGAHIVTNSWNSNPNSTFFAHIVRSWRKAGIIPIFSGGNTGPECGSIGSPGSYADVISVGSIGASFELSAFSSRGPSPLDGGNVRRGVKPDFVAPGEDVVSADAGSDSTYRLVSGTSTSAPIVAGIVTMILSAVPGIRYDDIVRALSATSATTSLIKHAGNQTCGGIHQKSLPNNHYGHGLPNAYAALREATDECSK